MDTCEMISTGPFLKSLAFWDVRCCSVVDGVFWGRCCLRFQSRKWKQVPSKHSSTLMADLTGSLETLVPIYQATWHHNSEDSNLQQKNCLTSMEQ
jgi:hypothetical protein